jgi:hypothetical protein
MLARKKPESKLPSAPAEKLQERELEIVVSREKQVHALRVLARLGAPDSQLIDD